MDEEKGNLLNVAVAATPDGTDADAPVDSIDVEDEERRVWISFSDSDTLHDPIVVQRPHLRDPGEDVEIEQQLMDWTTHLDAAEGFSSARGGGSPQRHRR
ncbi:hypothetical protein FOZ61_002306 [Perkinsus olseni]|uniref:Uncharacterized protein n=1 Tax=Perkinsus olseni TaxID=32597 RepID=A0A7J6LUY9_PEROL|nr:hypothetical protein FOZ61_002306 [Perkinsus olseni]KAF4668023.1 hypothetical protein FOL46_002180 [Perkinsus olseni]